MRAKNIIQKFKHILNKYVEQLDIKNSRNIGRPNKFNNFFYIKHILNYLFTGISWSNIELFIDDLSGDAITPLAKAPPPLLYKSVTFC